MILKASNIATLINEVYDGVERSKLGSIKIEEKASDGREQFNSLSYNAFMKVLESVLPKDVGLNVREDLK